MTSVTFSKMTGSSDEKTCDIIVDGRCVGHIDSRKCINFQPAKSIDFDAVEVTLWKIDEQAIFGADEYDAASALRAAKSWVKARLTA